MKQYIDYSDSRNRGKCAFCDELPNTIDHIPARTFLVKPYPENLHTVPACFEYNNISSIDEEYMAFVLRYLKLLENDNNMEI
jgi:hypothetical protein